MVWIKLQSTLNHVWMSGLLGDGFGAAYGMMRNVTVWVLSRMHLQEDHHPIWGKVSEIDTWVVTSGKNNIRRDWQIPPQTTGLVYAHATRDLSYNFLNASIPESLGQLISLRGLNLNGNSLRGRVPAALGGRPNLFMLCLAGVNELGGYRMKLVIF
ncbi:hypothetical protein POM88_041663 [Heracleum sosnowskyi]|uniref:Acyl-[acyl-carrier-protein] hydrolase n=1 Tax=Heracleum sosnowskyi TaxID=360622 RepID=A0AAD8HH82_9APIA|nr:hypothetical protein POM88_041663 [Heracleum sosnowskyi]